MKKRIILFLVIFIQLVSCENKKISIKNTETKNVQAKSKSIRTELKNSEYNVNVFFTEENNMYSSIDSMQFFLKENKIQTIDLKHKNLFYLTELIDSGIFIMYLDNDFNFDGYNDIETRVRTQPNFNYYFCYFLYDSINKKFKESNILENLYNKNASDSLYNIEVLTKKKVICASYYNHDRGYKELSKYKWKNDTLINIETIEAIKKEDGIFHLSIKKNNKTIISDSIVTKQFVEKLKCN